jgi:hypothetical protein
MKGRLFIAAILLAVIALPVVMAKKAKKKDSPKLLYAKKCAGGCHRLYKPKEYTSKQWIKILDEMSALAKLSEEERKVIEGYLIPQPAAEKVPMDGSATTD